MKCAQKLAQNFNVRLGCKIQYLIWLGAASEQYIHASIRPPIAKGLSEFVYQEPIGIFKKKFQENLELSIAFNQYRSVYISTSLS